MRDQHSKLSYHKSIGNLILILILCLQLANIVFWVDRKEAYFGDELYSYEFVCQTGYPSVNADRPEGSYLNRWHDSSYFQDYFTVSEEEKFDLKGTYRSIKKDVHPPIYYLLLHIACSLNVDVFSKWNGIGLNIVFFVITVYVLYRMAQELTENRIVPYVAIGLYGFSVAAVSTAVFIRMYMVLTCATVLFCYLHVRWYRNDFHEKDQKKRLMSYFLFLLCLVFGFLTQYYFVIFAFFVAAFWGLYLFFTKKYRIMIGYLGMMLLGLAVSYGLWPSMYKHIFQGYRGKEAFANFQGDSSHVLDCVKVINGELFAGQNILILALVAAVIALIAFDRKRMDRNGGIFRKPDYAIAFMAVACIGDLLIVSKVAPYQKDRYYFNIVPLILLIIVLLIGKISKNQKSYVRMAAMVLLTGLVFGSYATNTVQYLYPEYKESVRMSEEMAEIPVVLLTNKNARYTSNCACYYFLNGQIVYPIDQEGIGTIQAAFDEIGYHGKAVVYIDNTLDADAMLEEIRNGSSWSSATFLYDVERCKAFLLE